MGSIGVCGTWADIVVPEPVDPSPTSAGMLSLARGFGADPGPYGIGVLASLSLEVLDEAALVEIAGMFEIQAGWLAAARNEVLCALRDRTEANAAPGEDKDWEREELAAGCRLSGHEARVRMQTALALRDRLTQTAAALSAGAISDRHAQALAIETAPLPDSHAQLVEQQVLSDPRRVSARQFRDRARLLTAGLLPAVSVLQGADARANRSVRAWHNGDGTGELTALLPAADLAAVTYAIDALAGPWGPSDERSAEQRRADALIDLTTRGTQPTTTHATPPGPFGRAAVVLHIPFGLFTRDGTPAAPTINGEPVDPATTRKISCDSTLWRILTDPANDETIDANWSIRTPSPALRRALHVRDEGSCTFPGCTRHTNLHAHHIVHWLDGGPTTLANLTLLCPRHHHAIHDAAWHLDRHDNGSLTWRTPHGKPVHPPPTTWTPDPDPPWPNCPVTEVVSDLDSDPPPF
jgi:hypothetical protein